MRFALLILLATGLAQAHPPLQIPTWDELVQQETALLVEYGRLRREGYGAEQVTRDWMAAIQRVAFTPEDLTALRQAGSSRRNAGVQVPPQAVHLIDAMVAIDAEWSAFHDAYDRFIHAKTAYLVDRYMDAAHAILGSRIQALRLAPEGSPEHKLAAKYDELATLRLQFFEILHQKPVNQGDARRFSEARKFGEAFVEFWSEAASDKRTWVEAFLYKIENLRRLIVRATEWIAIAPEYYRAKRLIVQNKPVLSTIYPGFARAMSWMGYDFGWVGAERLNAPIAPGTARIYASSHNNGVLDAAVATAVPMERGRLFMAPTFFATEDEIAAFIQNDQFICVSMGSTPSNPMKPLLRDLKNASCDSIFIYPEGSLATGLSYEIRRPAENFADGVLSMTRNQGFGMEIFPISLPRHFRPWQDRHAADRSPTALPVIVHQPLTPLAVDLMMASGNPQIVSRWIRQHWMDAANDANHTDRPLGSPRLPALVRTLDTLLAQRGQCQAALQIAALLAD